MNLLVRNVLAFVFLAVIISRLSYFSYFTLPQSSDLGWLIRTGDWIRLHNAMPTHDLFCWWNHGKELISYQWLFEVMVSVANSTIGFWGIGLITTLLAGALLLYLLPKQWLSHNPRQPLPLKQRSS